MAHSQAHTFSPLYRSEPPAQRTVLPTVSWALLLQLPIKAAPSRHFHKPMWSRHFCNWSSQIIPGCLELKIKTDGILIVFSWLQLLSQPISEMAQKNLGHTKGLTRVLLWDLSSSQTFLTQLVSHDFNSLTFLLEPHEGLGAHLWKNTRKLRPRESWSAWSKGEQ